MAYKKITFYKKHKELCILAYDNNDVYHSIDSPAFIIYRDGILQEEEYFKHGVLYNSLNKPSSIKYYPNGQIKRLMFTNSIGCFANNAISNVDFNTNGDIVVQQYIFENGTFRRDCFE